MNFFPEKVHVKLNVYVFHRITIPAELRVLFCYFIFSCTLSFVTKLVTQSSTSIIIFILTLKNCFCISNIFLLLELSAAHIEDIAPVLKKLK